MSSYLKKKQVKQVKFFIQKHQLSKKVRGTTVEIFAHDEIFLIKQIFFFNFLWTFDNRQMYDNHSFRMFRLFILH